MKMLKNFLPTKLNQFAYSNLNKYLNNIVVGKQCISSAVPNDNNFKVAIIGSGPSGFYTGQQLLKVFILNFF